MMCRRGRFQAVTRICGLFVVLLVISEAADRVGIRRLDLPAYDVNHGSGNFTGVPDKIVYTPTNREPGPDVIGHSVRWRPPGNWPTRK